MSSFGTNDTGLRATSARTSQIMQLMTADEETTTVITVVQRSVLSDHGVVDKERGQHVAGTPSEVERDATLQETAAVARWYAA
jgi:hypothetical protein